MQQQQLHPLAGWSTFYFRKEHIILHLAISRHSYISHIWNFMNKDIGYIYYFSQVFFDNLLANKFWISGTIGLCRPPNLGVTNTFCTHLYIYLIVTCLSSCKVMKNELCLAVYLSIVALATNLMFKASNPKKLKIRKTGLASR